MPEIKKILIVEDEQILREILKKKLEHEGYEITTAEDGEQGLARIKTDPPDLVLLDLLLPKMGGMEVLRAIRQAEATKNLPVIVLSNSGQPVEVEEIVALGVTDYLIKTTFSPDDVIAKIRAAFGSPAPAKPGSNIVATPPSSRGKAKVLVAEDDQFLRELACKKLENSGYSLVTAIDGVEAVKRIIEERPDIVLLDVIMPGLDGFEVLKQIRQHADPAIASTKIIILSNLGQESDIQKGQELRANGYLVKANFTMDEIIQKVEQALQSKPLS